MKSADLKRILKRIIRDVCSDLKSIRIPLFCIAAYLVICRICFNEFCPMKIIFRIPCPACGLTHAGVRLLLLDFKGAWEYNPSIFLWVPLLLAMLIHRYIFRKDMKKMYPAVCIVIIATIAVFFARLALH